MTDDHTEDLPPPREDDPAAPPAIGSGSGGAIPKQIGKYHIKSLIATGGMGSVYMAVQEQPRRTVALKLMKRGIASRSALRRFEYESQLLARLRHPHIAEVYDAGTHDEGDGGTPYFVMEYIAGARRLTDYAREKKLPTRRKLELFLPVCDAVHHGHTKGIIHRDLKPDNILVDSHGRVKIIDFGVARATDSDLALTTLQTDIGQLIGTVQYMSPEQVEADPTDLDTRSDVYSLGVVLYELLTGKLPYDVKGVKIFEATRLIREQEAAKLSTIDSGLRGDIETIVLTAMAKDREHRYQSARGIRDDIEHYLRAEPITARPPSMSYQLRMFARRNKPLVTGIAAVFVALLLGVIGMAALWRQSESSRRDAEAARESEAEQRQLAEQQTQVAVAEAAQADRAVEVLTDMISSASPFSQNTADYTVRQMLDDFSQGLDQRMAEYPKVELRVRWAIGSAYQRQGKAQEAANHLRRALELRRRIDGPDQPRAGHILGILAWIAQSQNRSDEAIDLAEQALADFEAAGDTVYTAGALSALGHFYHSRNQPGDRAHALGRYERALDLLRQTPDFDRSAFAARTLHDLSGFLTEEGRLDEAEARARESVAIHERAEGEGHPQTLWGLTTLGYALFAKGQYKSAEDVFRRVHEGRTRLLGPDNRDTSMAKTQLIAAIILPDVIAGRYDAAAGRYEKELGTDAGSSSLVGLGILHAAAGNRQALARLFDDMVERFSDTSVAQTARDAAFTYLVLPAAPGGERDPRLYIASTFVDKAARLAETDGQNVVGLELTLGMSAFRRGDMIAAAERFIAARGSTFPVERAAATAYLAMVAHASGRAAEARRLLDEARAIIEPMFTPDDTVPTSVFNWPDKVHCRMALAEAEALINGPTPADVPSPPAP